MNQISTERPEGEAEEQREEDWIVVVVTIEGEDEGESLFVSARGGSSATPLAFSGNCPNAGMEMHNWK